MILIFYVIFTFMMWLSMVIPCVGLVFLLGMTGYVTRYLMRVINSSADGDETPPDLPSWRTFWESCLLPLFQVLVLLIVCLGPMGALGLLGAPTAAVVAAGIGGGFILPMCFLGMATAQSIFGIRPLRALVAITKAPGQYLVALVILAIAVVVSEVLTVRLQDVAGLFGQLGATFLSLYFLMVKARVLGLLYHANRDRFAWYGEDL